MISFNDLVVKFLIVVPTALIGLACSLKIIIYFMEKDIRALKEEYEELDRLLKDLRNEEDGNDD